ncbi:MAG: glycosyltransferase family 2 protein [Bacteroides sp.]|nr:glycosyltransferase family 2 protein [Roseburia sp.]MCM1345477.1 glycosyltransferase family 2 protein [Bacteroides sp.]MCM1419987.1 glycosyltransferase family 2 protein [Bacteroides sp.]
MYAGIVLYNSEIEIVKRNIKSIQDTGLVDKIILVDNGSGNINEIKQLYCEEKFVILIENPENKGIATALNQMCEVAFQNSQNRLITLDDDSIIPIELIKAYKEIPISPNTGIITCRIEDRNYGRMHTKSSEGIDDIKFCISSGSLLNIDAWKVIGGFCERLFIDGVDFDICIRLRKAGYKIKRLNYVCLNHEIGHGRKVHILGHDAFVLNHSRLRLYYITRNYLYLGIKHHQLKYWGGEVCKRFLLVALYEKDKLGKLAYMIKGLFHGLTNSLGKYH